MASFEELEFEELIGDQLVNVRKSHKELLAEGKVELTIDGHKISLPRITEEYDPVGKRSTSRPTTIYDAANELYVEQLKQTNPIPVLCHREHMTPVAVCRVCMVDVKNSRGLVPACQRPIEKDMEVSTIATSDRVRKRVGTLIELLLSDYHAPEQKDRQFGENELLTIARTLEIKQGRFPRGAATRPRDDSSLLIAVDHNACILCDRCIRGCNEIRHREVLGRMGKGYTARIAFDLDDPMGNSSCVTCGECMVSCPTGALTNRVVGKGFDHEGETVRPEELAELRLFRGISLPFLRWNANAVCRRRFRKGEVVCPEGEYGSTAFIMEKGRFEVRINAPLSRADKKRGGGLFGFLGNLALGRGGRSPEVDENRPNIAIDAPVSLRRSDPVAILEPKDVLFGEMTCMSQYPRSATVTALDDDCTVLEIQRNVLYMLQRNAASRLVFEAVYRRRTLETHLRSVKLFASLMPSDDEFTKFVNFLRKKVRLVRVSPAQVIVRQGEAAEHFYMVRSGFVKVSETRQGIERVNYIGPGGYFGEIGLLGHLAEKLGIVAPGVRVATCSALDHVDLVRMDKKTFLELLELFPKVSEHIVETARLRLVENEQRRTQSEDAWTGDFLEQGLMNAGNALVLDLECCTRCDECTRACADAHDGVTRLIREGLRFDKYLVASSCRSCYDPYCLIGCPTSAIKRTGVGDIDIDRDACIGCGKCAENCPYGNINMVGFDTREADPANPQRRIAVRRQKATTCDKCASIGGEWRCVYACPHEAAHRMSGSELLELVRKRNSRG